MISHFKRRLSLAAGLLLLTSTAFAGDGRIEFNQASIMAAGGFPHTLSVPGSYLMTGSLVVPDGTTGIRIAAHEVSIDLNGFGIRGPHECNASTCSGGASIGIEALPLASELARSTTVRNGVVSGFAGACLDLGAGAHVEDLIVRSCGGSGVRAAEHSRVEGNRISDSGGWGLEFVATAGYGTNIISNVDRLGSTGFIAGGASSGGNLCDTGRCPGERRRFYLTTTGHQGNHGANDCAAGFHMASIFEILDPSNLDYDRQRGKLTIDSGSGPPNDFGWIRTGSASPNGTACASSPAANPWSSNNPSDLGVLANPVPGVLGSPPDNNPRWFTQVFSCAVPAPLWCIED